MMANGDHVDVVVVGAGLAGLSAARSVADAGRSVVVVEARDRVGGRTWTRDLGDGAVVDLGGSFAGPTQDEVYALAAELGIEAYPTYDTGDNVLHVRGKAGRYTGTIPRINPLVLADIGQAQVRLNRLARQVPLHAPWQAGRAHQWDGQTFETWMRRNVRTSLARWAIALAVEAVFACEPADVSLLHVLFYVHAGGRFERLTDTSGGAQQDRFVGGTQPLSIGLADRLGPDVVRLSSPVRRIAWGDAGVTVESDGAAGRVAAQRAIVAVPPALAGRIDYDPLLPGWRDQLTQRAPMGSVMKCMAVYDEPFWRADGLTGQATGDGPAVRVTFDVSPPDGRPGILLGFVEGDEARRLGRVTADERRREVIAAFVRYFGGRAAAPADYVELDWQQEQWTRGCYGAHFAPGVWTAYGPALRQPIGPIHWAGTECAEEWSGYMDGAIRSGKRAAADVLATL